MQALASSVARKALLMRPAAAAASSGQGGANGGHEAAPLVTGLGSGAEAAGFAGMLGIPLDVGGTTGGGASCYSGGANAALPSSSQASIALASGAVAQVLSQLHAGIDRVATLEARVQGQLERLEGQLGRLELAVAAVSGLGSQLEARLGQVERLEERLEGQLGWVVAALQRLEERPK